MVALLVCFKMLVTFLMVCNMVCMIGIPNLVNLSKRDLLCVLVDIGLLLMRIAGGIFLISIDEFLLRAFLPSALYGKLKVFKGMFDVLKFFT